MTNVEIVPLIISGSISQDRAESLSTALTKLKDEHSIVIVSSDMSHYLLEKQALMNDEKTLKALQSNDENFFWAATDDFTDNGKSIWIAMRVLDRPTWILQSKNISSRYGGSGAYTTTYLNGFWK
jgi:AmmeMemoRadiSam system protein B